MNKLLNFAKGADLETGISMAIYFARNEQGEAYLMKAERLADGIDPPLCIAVIHMNDTFSEAEVSRITAEAKRFLTSNVGNVENVG